MSSRHSRYKSHADRVWPRAAERSPRTYKVRAMRRSLAFEGLGFAVARGAALHRIGCRVPDGGATSAVLLAAKSSSCHMAREMVTQLLNVPGDGVEGNRMFLCSRVHRGLCTSCKSDLRTPR